MKTRKILALVLSLVMVFSLCGSAFAAHLTDEVTELEQSQLDAFKIETVTADGDETEVGVYYLGAEEITGIKMSIDSELPIKSFKAQDGRVEAHANEKVIAFGAKAMDTSKPVLTIVVDTADAASGTYAISGTVLELVNKYAELIATVPVIAGAVIVSELGDMGAFKIETVTADGDETEVGVYYLGNEEIMGIKMTINSELEIKSVKTQDSSMAVYENGVVLVFGAKAMDASEPILTLVVDTANAEPGTYEITGTVDELINSDPAVIEVVPVIAGSVIVRVPGDVDGDGVVTTADLVAIARHIIGAEELTAAQIAVADIDGDGIVTTFDIVLIACMMVVD